jgi:hypothetical protein
MRNAFGFSVNPTRKKRRPQNEKLGDNANESRNPENRSGKWNRNM